MTLFDRLKCFLRLVNQFDEVPKIPLESPIEEALRLYGKPCEQKPYEDFPEVTEYGFLVTGRIDILVGEWQGKVHWISFWGRRWEDPGRDLQFVLDAYGEQIGWNELEKGYLYRRKDGKFLLNCSAMPVIGVKTAAYSRAEADYRNAQKAKGQAT